MSLFVYDVLPRYIMVQVSSERWCVAELSAQSGEGGYIPQYEACTGRLTLGQCGNKLRELQAAHERERGKR